MSTLKNWKTFFLAAGMGIFATVGAHAQGVDSTAKKVGNKTAEIAVKGAATITQKVYKGKEGPNGETVYITKDDRKFIVNDKGKRVYLKKSQIHDKKD
ncbi:hypothetical protein GA0116948_11265 [Chitinophaga costaii]|uniref:PBCV-specific basic adaptor domain-containing protein n=1 Tax=Chitinophaga costaii TaxID=1335309 RepID=A0A1C4F7Y5_9BACT|nr:hypothetical protein [Chitinophaga costaii]SCC51753.1 hypothetical protein GA0116948_11265 [Chitinophaga costaii]